MAQFSRFYGIQTLRGFAACMVVITHSTLMIRDKMGYTDAWQFPAGAAGVDVFFCISGFVMLMSSARYEQSPTGWQTFIRHRLVRILPLYWLLTTVKLVTLIAWPDLGGHSDVMPWHTIASYLFIPAWNRDHETVPLVQVGWTLNYEMFFYALVAIALARRQCVIRSLTVILLPLALLGFFRTNDWGAVSVLARPLLAEFVLGMWVALAVTQGRIWPRVPATIGAIGAIVFLCATNYFPGLAASGWRVVCWGGAAALLVYCVASLESATRPVMARIPILLGDASYSIYLFESFVLAALSAALTPLHLSFIASLLASVLVSLGCGIALHVAAEKPMGHKLKELSCRN